MQKKMESLNSFFNENKQILPMKAVNTFKKFVDNVEELRNCFDLIQTGKTEKYFVRDREGIFNFFNRYSK